MSQESAYRIMLLPHIDYWAWVGAAKDYAVRFQTTLTPTPQNAARYHFPKQIISVVLTHGGYPQYGDIVNWLRREASEVRLDIVSVESADELAGILNERIARGDATWLPAQSGKAPQVDILIEQRQAFVPLQLDMPSIAVESHLDAPILPLPISLLWPTDYPDILQGFGDNPELYQRFGYPGHEGIDIKAPLNSNVYACAAGRVYRVDDGASGHPYGIHVRMRHVNGFSTIYAHLNQAFVHVGQEVGAGEQIGLANSTGNATTSHLHLSLMQDGATHAGLTAYPEDIIDPTPYLIGGPQQAPSGVGASESQHDRCLRGVNVNSPIGIEYEDQGLLTLLGVEAVKTDAIDSVDFVEQHSSLFVLGHLSAHLDRRRVSPTDFVAQVMPQALQLYELGSRYFEIHTEPNLSVEGFGTSWGSGGEFGDWFLAVVALLRPQFPDVHFGWPGLSPGGTEGMRVDFRLFLEGAYFAVTQADWIGCHSYWQSRNEMFAYHGGLSYRHYRDLWPDKPLIITNFANVGPTDRHDDKLEQYREYFAFLGRESGIAGAFVSMAHLKAEILPSMRL